ncbi:heavy metal translocating P-type ATPase [Xylariaceae sp. FL1272]|nr:heavy metal translocating P-type ATPase [Xylariaceae sp. FL1272]
MAPSMPSQAPSPTVTTFLIANLHCPTCVSTIKHALQDLDGVAWVSPNIITSCVAVEHDTRIPIMHIASKLEAAGFEVSSASIEDLASTPPNPKPAEAGKLTPFDNLDGSTDWITTISGRFRHSQATFQEERVRAHLKNCEQCRTAGAGGDSPRGVTSEETHATQKAGANEQNIPPVASTPSSSTVSGGAGTPKAWRATLAISGMTCASCVNAISAELNKQNWVTNVAINLLSNSGVIEYNGVEDQALQLVEKIEDIGYDVHLDQNIAIDDEKGDIHERTVQIRIDGFYCPHCGDRAVCSIGGFQHELRIVSRPTLQRPLLEVTYTPKAPNFTVRHILAALEASDPAFTASIFHPPTLEARSKQIQARHQKEIFLRALVTTIIAIPTFIIGIVYMSLVQTGPGRELLMKPWVSGINRAQIALFILATPVYFLTADLFHRRTIKEVRTIWRPGSQVPILRRFYRFGSMNMLISLGTSIAYISSVAQMIAAAVQYSRHRDFKADDADFSFDTVIFLTLFLLAGRYLEAYSKSKTGNAVEALGKLRPTTALLLDADTSMKPTVRVVHTDMLDIGDVVQIPHGTSPPCDGEILKGESVFDESSLTGESRPIKKSVGDQVFSGTVNKGALISIRVTGTAGQSMLDQIVKVVREGQTKRAPMEKVADALVAYFVPAIVLIAILTFVIWLAVAEAIHLSDPVVFSLRFAIAVFVVACPCGLALAAPTAIFVGGGIAAQHGILVKGGGEAFETASRVDCIVFDKTGTLTAGGEPSVTDSNLYGDESTREDSKASLLGVLRAMEENSSHPIAKAIVNFCKNASPDVTVDNVEELPGKGMKASCFVGSKNEHFDVVIGNEVLMRDFAVDISFTTSETLRTWKTEAKSVALIATTPKSLQKTPGGTYRLAAALAISDPIRPESATVIKELRSNGTDVWMLSGDNVVTARAVALRIGIPEDNVIAEVLPAQKFEKIKYLQSTLKAGCGSGKEHVDRRATVAMVGDGINDAPALSMADVGIAIGSGSDVAISSADFVLVNSNLMSVVTLLQLSRKVFWRIKFNFGWALVYNLVALPFAAGCFWAIRVNGRHIVLDPVFASLAMALSSLSVVTSSLALKTRIPGFGFREKTVPKPRDQEG